MSDWQLRVRQYLDAYLSVVVATFVILALAGGWLAYTAHVVPGTQEETRTVASWEERSAFGHRATVREPNPLYDEGTTLENRSAYFRSATPILNGSFRYGYTASEGGNTTVDVRTVFVVRAVENERNSENVTVLWQRTQALDEAQAENLAAGETVVVPFSVNVSRAANLTERVDENLGSAGEVEAQVRARVDVEGTVNGEEVDRTETHNLSVTLDDVYRVDGASATEQFETTETVATPVDSGPVRALGGPLLLGLSLAVLGGVAVGRSRDAIALSPAERERLDYESDRAEFDEWITRIRLPESVRSRPRAEAESLADLVDFAIDTDSGVIEAPDRESYCVVGDDLLYVYEPPTPESRSADSSTADGPGDTPRDESADDARNGP
jgi:hypothetical protein